MMWKTSIAVLTISFMPVSNEEYAASWSLALLEVSLQALQPKTDFRHYDLIWGESVKKLIDHVTSTCLLTPQSLVVGAVRSYTL